MICLRCGESTELFVVGETRCLRCIREVRELIRADAERQARRVRIAKDLSPWMPGRTA